MTTAPRMSRYQTMMHTGQELPKSVATTYAARYPDMAAQWAQDDAKAKAQHQRDMSDRERLTSPAECELCVPTITTAPDTGITISAHETECRNHPHHQEN